MKKYVEYDHNKDKRGWGHTRSIKSTEGDTLYTYIKHLMWKFMNIHNDKSSVNHP